ncbi:MAG TPA: YlbF family regulator [Phycisphaerae bacterium]|nr:YlbF family regulator [Phycisphaerae bacterium]
MNEIIQIAERLGNAVAQSAQAASLRAARKAFDEQPDAEKLLADYQAQADKIAQLDSQAKPVEVEDKHKLQELHDKLVANELFKRLTAAQVEYVDLMRRVNNALRRALAETEGEP